MGEGALSDQALGIIYPGQNPGHLQNNVALENSKQVLTVSEPQWFLRSTVGWLRVKDIVKFAL